MAFMTSNSGGDFKVFVSFNAKAGRWYTKEDKPDAEQFEVENMTAIFDMENIRTGWFKFTAGSAPEKNFDPSLTQAAPKPGDDFKRGFELELFSEKNLLGLREFASTAGAVIEAMNDLHDHWQTDAAANPGKLPVVKSVGVTPVTSKHGTNYRPQLEIVAWADRPAEMGGGATKAAAAPPPAAKAPAKQPAPAAAVADDEPEF
jgi:hypothetical protein